VQAPVIKCKIFDQHHQDAFKHNAYQPQILYSFGYMLKMIHCRLNIPREKQAILRYTIKRSWQFKRHARVGHDAILNILVEVVYKIKESWSHWSLRYFSLSRRRYKIWSPYPQRPSDSYQRKGWIDVYEQQVQGYHTIINICMTVPICFHYLFHFH
jgi:hypothetical protein